MNRSASTSASPMSVEPSMSRFSTEKAPAEAPIYVLTLDAVAFLIVPPAPSSTTIKSDVVKAAPMSVPPSISKADNDTLPAVDIVSSLLSAIAALEFMSALTITPDPMAAVPPDIVISPLIVP